MITVTIAVKDGVHTRGDILELSDLAPEDLARVDELILEMRDHIDRIARVRAAKRVDRDRT